MMKVGQKLEKILRKKCICLPKTNAKIDDCTVKKAVNKKLASKKGFTMAEVLVALALVVLLTAAISVGIAAGGRMYNSIIKDSKANTLCSTLSLEISNELRYASDIKLTSGHVPVFNSQKFGNNVQITANDGRVLIGTSHILSEKAYTGLNADIEVEYDEIENNFSVVVIIFDEAAKELTRSEFKISPI